MGTSLTPEFWQLFALLLVAAMGVTFVLTAALDALAVRLLRRHVRRPPVWDPPRPTATDHRASVHR
ncbi:hypothetical protein OK074_0189 [Actinobacteria bacterium OK074]|nr:hypothetical protein OK074_0189 [Actinobacteria bacterium OK074]